MWISFSKYNTYLSCPKKYKYQMDKTPKPEEESKYFALYGLLIESFFKDYTNILLPNNVSLNKNKIKNILEKKWDYILNKEYINWKDPWVKQTPNQIFEEVYEDVLENIEAFDFWPQTRAEITYKINLKKSRDVLNGRIDFVRTLSGIEDGVEILDGKGTKHLDRVDPEQLLFYSLLYFFKHKILPKKIGFLYYRYKIIKYIDLNKDILLTFKNKLALAKKAIKLDKKFEAKVLVSKTCLWCPYKLICNPYLNKKEANSKKRSKIKDVYNGEIVNLSF